MSALRDIQVVDWLFKYNTKIFFETGTGLGSGIMRMMQIEYGMRSLISCEIDKELATHSQKTFSFDNRVQIFHSTGVDALSHILPQVRLELPIMYWLDSHFQNSDYNLGDKPLVPHSQGDVDIRLPIWNEVNLIKKIRIDKGAKDLILIDDAMLYDPIDRYEDKVERLGVGAVPQEQRNLLPKIIDLFKNTHRPQVITLAQGFLVLHPLHPSQS